MKFFADKSGGESALILENEGEAMFIAKLIGAAGGNITEACGAGMSTRPNLKAYGGLREFLGEAKYDSLPGLNITVREG